MPDIVLFAVLMLAGTFFLGFNDVQNKQALTHGVDERILVGVPFFVGGLALFLISAIVGFPEIKEGFWQSLAITTVLNVVLQYAFMRAFAVSDASFVAPLRLLIPPLVIMTGFLFLRETPSLSGFVGIALTLVGFWFLFAPELKGRKEARARSSEAVLWGLLGAVLSAFSFVFDKIAVVTSSGLFATAAIATGVGLLTLLIASQFGRRLSLLTVVRTVRQNLKLMGMITVTRSLGTLFTTQALQFSLIAYASSFKRLQAFWTVVLSDILLKEKKAPRRLLATVIMFSGMFITIFWP